MFASLTYVGSFGFAADTTTTTAPNPYAPLTERAVMLQACIDGKVAKDSAQCKQVLNQFDSQSCDQTASDARDSLNEMNAVCSKAGLPTSECLQRAKNYQDDCTAEHLDKIDKMTASERKSDDNKDETFTCSSAGMTSAEWLKNKQDLQTNLTSARDKYRKLQNDIAKEAKDAADSVQRLKEKAADNAADFRRDGDRTAKDNADSVQNFNRNMNELEVKKAETRAAKFPKQQALAQTYSDEVAKMIEFTDIEGQCKDAVRESYQRKAIDNRTASNFFATAAQNKAAILRTYQQCVAAKMAQKKNIRAQFASQREQIKNDLDSFDDQVQRLEQSRQSEVQSFAQMQQRFTQGQKQAMDELTAKQQGLQDQMNKLNSSLSTQATNTQKSLDEANTNVTDLENELAKIGPRPPTEKPMAALSAFESFRGSVDMLLNDKSCKSMAVTLVSRSQGMLKLKGSDQSKAIPFYSKDFPSDKDSVEKTSSHGYDGNRSASAD